MFCNPLPSFSNQGVCRGDGSDKRHIHRLPTCIEDARQAGLDQDPNPMEPLQFNALRGRLQAAQAKIPPLYREEVFTPFVQTLDEIGESGFNQILVRDPERESVAGLMLDIAQAILQRWACSLASSRKEQRRPSNGSVTRGISRRRSGETAGAIARARF